jgi:hypothetical protein
MLSPLLVLVLLNGNGVATRDGVGAHCEIDKYMCSIL